MGDGRFKKGLIPWNKGSKPFFTCPVCNKLFQAGTLKRAKVRYCSNHCKNTKSLSRLKPGNISWNKGKKNPYFQGSKHWAWKGGLQWNVMDRNIEGWKELRLICYARDKYECQKCFKKCKKDIQAHHMIPRSYGGPDVLQNLVTLCKSCHVKVERRITERMNNLRELHPVT